MKTITIHIEAYESLRRGKRPGQHFSDVIKDLSRSGATGQVLRKVVDEITLDPSTLDAMDALIQERSADRADAPGL